MNLEWIIHAPLFIIHAGESLRGSRVEVECNGQALHAPISLLEAKTGEELWDRQVVPYFGLYSNEGVGRT